LPSIFKFKFDVTWTICLFWHIGKARPQTNSWMFAWRRSSKFLCWPLTVNRICFLVYGGRLETCDAGFGVNRGINGFRRGKSHAKPSITLMVVVARFEWRVETSMFFGVRPGPAPDMLIMNELCLIMWIINQIVNKLPKLNK
jgi:hypothetical protein